MDKADFYPFLVRVAIPEASKEHLPEVIEETNCVWDAIWRAHRDVLTARKNIEGYLSFGHEPYVNKDQNCNLIPAQLYEIITGNNGKRAKLCTAELIAALQKPFEFNNKEINFGVTVEFGALQKLVNMTLKYLLLLQCFDVEDEMLAFLDPINEVDCDCPLDSSVLSHTKEYKHAKWTQLDQDTYGDIQKEIVDICGNDPKLKFDLIYWPNIAIGDEK